MCFLSCTYDTEQYICLYSVSWRTIGGTSRATLEISPRWLNITICQILCRRWFWEMLQFRRFLELFLLLQFQNHLWHRMVCIVIFNRLAGIPNVALLVRPMVHCEILIIHINYLNITVRNMIKLIYAFVIVSCTSGYTTSIMHQWLHHSWILAKSMLRETATAGLSTGLQTTASSVESSA